MDKLQEQKEDLAKQFVGFFENANEGQIGNYFLKFRKSLISSNDRNAVFIDEVANAADRLVFKAQEVLMMG